MIGPALEWLLVVAEDTGRGSLVDEGSQTTGKFCRAISSMHKLNRVGLRGQPCFTPARIGMDLVRPIRSHDRRRRPAICIGNERHKFFRVELHSRD